MWELRQHTITHMARYIPKIKSVVERDDVVGLNINTTQFTGIACFSATAVCTLWAAVMGTNGKLWLGLTALNTFLAIEVVTNNRHSLTNFARVLLKQSDLLDIKRRMQIALLICLCISLGFVVAALIRIWSRYQLPEKTACLAALTLCAIFLTEIISLHSIDIVLYSSFEGVLVIGYLWGICSFLVLIAAFENVRRQNPKNP
jgi:uncharacterized membrane protein YozB (DUF420 family)